MAYLVRLSNRALGDLGAIYEAVKAEAIENSYEWFTGLEQTIFSLEENPRRGAVAAESEKLRRLLYGRKPHVYRILYAIDERRNWVNVVHIRHGARDAFDLNQGQ